MTLTLLFDFPEPTDDTEPTFKDPVTIDASHAALVPMVGDIIESNDGAHFDVAARVFDWTADPGPSVLLMCEPHRGQVRVKL